MSEPAWVPLGAALDPAAYQTRSEKGAASGYAGLDTGGKVPLAQLPAWQDWTPIVTQGVTVAHTAVRAKYIRIGNAVHLQAFLAINGSGTAGTVIGISGLSIPIVMAQAGMGTFGGGFWMNGIVGGPGPNISGVTVAPANTTLQFILGGQGLTNYVGAIPSFGLAAGQGILAWGTYEAA